MLLHQRSNGVDNAHFLLRRAPGDFIGAKDGAFGVDAGHVRLQNRVEHAAAVVGFRDDGLNPPLAGLLAQVDQRFILKPGLGAPPVEGKHVAVELRQHHPAHFVATPGRWVDRHGDTPHLVAQQPVPQCRWAVVVTVAAQANALQALDAMLLAAGPRHQLGQRLPVEAHHNQVPQATGEPLGGAQPAVQHVLELHPGPGAHQLFFLQHLLREALGIGWHPHQPRVGRHLLGQLRAEVALVAVPLVFVRRIRIADREILDLETAVARQLQVQAGFDVGGPQHPDGTRHLPRCRRLEDGHQFVECRGQSLLLERRDAVLLRLPVIREDVGRP